MSLNKMIVEQLDLFALRSRVAITKDIVKGLETENSNLKRQIEWLQEEIDRTNKKYFKLAFGRKEE